MRTAVRFSSISVRRAFSESIVSSIFTADLQNRVSILVDQWAPIYISLNSQKKIQQPVSKIELRCTFPRKAIHRKRRYEPMVIILVTVFSLLFSNTVQSSETGTVKVNLSSSGIVRSEPVTLSESEKVIVNFVRSLAYLLHPGSWIASPNPDIVPNIWGCKINWTAFDECNAREKLSRKKVNYCPAAVAASIGIIGCDLMQDEKYFLTKSDPLQMVFRIQRIKTDDGRLDGTGAVSFNFNFKTSYTPVPIPDLLNSKDYLPWQISDQAVGANFQNGKVMDANGKVLAVFSLSYKLLAPGNVAEVSNNIVHSGVVDVAFSPTRKIRQEYSLPFQK